jgi:TonB-dependent starch-binding outer membrane protein SusC
MLRMLRSLNVHLKVLMVFALILGSTQVWAQVNITGTVSDPAGGGLPGVTVVVEGTTHGTATDVEGKFSLPVASAKSVLVFSYIGYTAKKITVGNQTNMQVILQPDAKALEEVVVVGYGTQAKRDVTGSIVSVSTEKIEKGSPCRFSMPCRGRLPGCRSIPKAVPGEKLPFASGVLLL